MNMELVLLGTGHAMVTRCYNTCFVLGGGERYFLVDAGGGNGILVQTEKAGISFGKIKEMFVTHAHTDHILGAVWAVRKVAALMRQEAYQGELTVFGHEKAGRLLRMMCEEMLPGKFRAFLDKRIHIAVVEDGEQREFGGMKSNNVKKSLSGLLCLSLVCAMLLAFAGCGAKNEIAGNWKGEMDLTDAMTTMLGSSVGDESITEYIKISDVTLILNLSLDKDGKYTMSIDEEKAKSTMGNVVDSMKSGMREYIEKLISDQGMDLSVDDYFQMLAGTSYDEYVNSMMDVDTLMSQFEDMKTKGTYEAKDGKLVLKDEDGGETEFDFEIKDSKMTLDSDMDVGFDMFPLEMERQ